VKTFELHVFLNYKRIISCSTILHEFIYAENVEEARSKAKKFVRNQEELSKHIVGDTQVEELLWNQWGPSDRWGDMVDQIETEWFIIEDGLNHLPRMVPHEGCFRIWLQEYIMKEPEACPECGRYYEEY